MTMLTLSYHKALPVIVPSHETINLIVVGCGGTGSFLIPRLARLCLALQEKGLTISITLIDGDRVEEKNIPRQNFAMPEVGLNKSIALAGRHALAFGLDIKAIPDYFKPHFVTHQWNALTVIIGCVDNACARKQISEVICQGSSPGNRNEANHLWWLDCGNHGNGLAAGQVLLGNVNNFNLNIDCNDPQLPSFWVNLPSPVQQHPELIAPPVESSLKLSCAELTRQNAQALFINDRVAIEAVQILSEFLLVKRLRRFACYFDCESGSARSLYTDWETLAKFGARKQEPVA